MVSGRVAGSGGRLLGRQAELAAWDRLLNARRSNGAGALAVEGEPGIGKTRLLAELALRARSRHLDVLEIAGGDRPFGLVVELLDARAAAADGAWPEPADGWITDMLAAVVPGARMPDRADPYLVGRAVRALLERRPVRETLVVAIDDLQRADAGSAAVLGYLLHHPPRAPVVLVAAFRPRQMNPGLLDALDAPCVTRVSLAGLTRTDLAAPAAGLCGRHRRALWDVSGGNPRQAEMLLSECAGHTGCGGRPFATRADASLPRSAAAVRLELGELTTAGTQVVRAAAVAGEPFDLDLVAAIAQLDEETAVAGIDALLAADVVRAADEAGRFRFRDPTVRQVAYTMAPGGWRLTAHRRALRLLRARGEPPPRYAAHLEPAASPGDLAAAAELCAAARTVETRAPGDAVDWYRAALRLLPQVDEALPRRAELMLAAARCCLADGRLTDAAELLRQRDDLPASVDPTSLAEVSECRAALARGVGRHMHADALLREALRLSRADLAERATAGLRLALADSPHATAVTADDALLSAVGVGDPVLQAHALTMWARTRLAEGLTGPALSGAEEAARLTDAQSDAAVVDRLTLLADLGRVEAHLERYAAAIRHLSLGIDLGTRSGQWAVTAAMLVTVGWVEVRRARYASAGEHGQRATEIAETLEAPETLAAALTVRASATDPRDLRSVEAVLPGYIPARLAAAAVDPRTDVAELVDACGGPLLPSLSAHERVAVYELLTRLDRREVAPLWARRADAAALGLPGQRASAALARAHAADEPAEAVTHARQAIEGAQRAGHLADVVRARLRVGRSLTLMGDPSAAQEWALARDVAQRTESPWLLAEVDEVTGPAVSSLTAEGDGLGLLSRREYEVAVLVSHGRTNRQIARALAVSHKTVETHLGRTFAKLGVSSRAQIANLVGRAGSDEAGAPDAGDGRQDGARSVPPRIRVS